jgi:hypothetical protein
VDLRQAHRGRVEDDLGTFEELDRVADRDGEVDAGPADPADHDAHHLPLLVQNRTAGVARVQRGVELNPVQFTVLLAQGGDPPQVHTDRRTLLLVGGQGRSEGVSERHDFGQFGQGIVRPERERGRFFCPFTWSSARSRAASVRTTRAVRTVSVLSPGLRVSVTVVNF